MHATRVSPSPPATSVVRVDKLVKICSSYAEFEMRRRVLKHTPNDLGAWTRRRLERMGPTFVKIGQFLSTRSDVLGDEFVAPLRGLCDNVMPLAFEDVAPYIRETEAQNAVDLCVQPAPLASASIAQVHRGTLDGVDGDVDVAIKVKRPFIERQIVEDFETLLFSIDVLKRVSSDHKIKEFEVMFREFFEILRYEIDFQLEVSNLQRFARLVRDMPDVRVPRPIAHLCTADVIVMDYLPSIRVDDVEGMRRMGVDTVALAQRLADLMLQSLIEFGLVHIDPHPGNLGLSQDDEIVMYDFGMVMDLGSDVQDQLTRLLFAVADRDVRAIRTTAIDMGMVVVEPADVPVFDRFLSSAIVYMNTADFESFRASFLATQRDPSDVPFALSSRFVLLLRGLSILEGVCKRLDPDFNAQAYIERQFRNRFADVRYLEARALADIRSLWGVPSRVDDASSRLDMLERAVTSSNNDGAAISALQTAWSVAATLVAAWFALT